MVDLTTQRQKLEEIYYSTCILIDTHNICRQESIVIEKRLAVQPICFGNEWGQCLVGIPRHHYDNIDQS